MSTNNSLSWKFPVCALVVAVISFIYGYSCGIEGSNRWVRARILQEERQSAIENGRAFYVKNANGDIQIQWTTPEVYHFEPVDGGSVVAGAPGETIGPVPKERGKQR